MKIILASASPRRRELLSTIYNEFSILKPDCEEKTLKSPLKTVKNLARLKAEAISSPYDVLISADTIVK